MNFTRGRRRMLPLAALIAALLAATWMVHWYFFQLPSRSANAAAPIAITGQR